MSFASVFSRLFGGVTRAEHDKKIAALRAEIARLTAPLREGEIGEVLAQMEEHRDTHRGWLSFIETSPDDPRILGAGDKDHHLKYLARYEGFIALLVRMHAELARLRQ